MITTKYSINEIFYSLQGEGLNAGRPAVFIRFAGCNLRCPFCDTDWKKGVLMSAEEIISEAQAAAKVYLPSLVVLTGGEPTLQLNSFLLDRLHTKFAEIAIETNGTQPIPEGIDFITISPKDDFVKEAESKIGKADEIKIVFDGNHNPEFWYTHIVAREYFLQPCDTGNEVQNRCIVEKCIKYIKEHPWWRLSLQTQKIVGIR